MWGQVQPTPFQYGKKSTHLLLPIIIKAPVARGVAHVLNDGVIAVSVISVLFFIIVSLIIIVCVFYLFFSPAGSGRNLNQLIIKYFRDS